MTDKELLELAAKAAGLPHQWHEVWGGMFVPRQDGTWGTEPWNPLGDDGDALRLALALRLMIAWDKWNNSEYACIRHRGLKEEIGIQIDQSPEKTVRRAIVLAAAEIGGEE